MRRRSLALLISLSWAALLPGMASVQIDWVSRYVWRGFDLLPDNHSALQPAFAIDLGRSGVSLSLWGSFALERRSEFRSADEIDVTFSYAVPLPSGWEMDVGINHYGYWFADDFTLRDDTSQEIFVALARTDLPLSPTLSVYYDFNLGSGLYVSLAVSQEIRMSDQLGMEVGGLIGFNSRQYIDKTGLSDIDLFIKAPLALNRLTLTPSLNVMVPLMDEVNEDMEVWFGFSAAF